MVALIWSPGTHWPLAVSLSPIRAGWGVAPDGHLAIVPPDREVFIAPPGPEGGG